MFFNFITFHDNTFYPHIVQYSIKKRKIRKNQFFKKRSIRREKKIQKERNQREGMTSKIKTVGGLHVDRKTEDDDLP